jgi:hypothetical protein
MNFDYTVEYYFDGVKNASLTESDTAKYGAVIDKTFDFKREEGSTSYIFDHADNNPLTITAHSAKNVIKVYYLSDTDKNEVPDVEVMVNPRHDIKWVQKDNRWYWSITEEAYRWIYKSEKNAELVHRHLDPIFNSIPVTFKQIN